MNVPPPRAPGRRGRVALRNVVLLLAALAGLVAVRWSVTGGVGRPIAPPASTAPSVLDGPDARALAALRGNLLFLGGRQPLRADPSSGEISSVPSPGAGRVRMLRQGAFVVLLARDGQVAVQPAKRAAEQRPLGQATDVLPGPRGDRVWLVTQESLVPSRTFVLREVHLPSRRLLRRWTLPYDAEPVAIASRGVVVRTLENHLEVRDPRGRRPALDLGRDLTFLDVHGDLLAYLDERSLHLNDLDSGEHRVLVPPVGARSWFALGPTLPGTGCCQQLGAFSPDGRTLAVFTQLTSPGGPGLTVVDVRGARARTLEGSTGATPIACLPCLGWSSSGWLFFFNGGAAVAEIAAWRPGAEAAIPLGLDLRSVTTVLPAGVAAA